MSNTKYVTLSSVCDYCSDRVSAKDVTANNYISTENMLLNKGGIEMADSVPELRTFPGYAADDILLSNIRPYFKKIWFADRSGGCSNDVLVLRAKENTDARFLYYVLSDSNFFNYDTVTSKGTKMPRGSKTAIMKYLVPDIDLPTQERIADILSAYDDLIENNNRRIALLEKAARELYKEWFVRFRFPGYETAQFKDGLPSGWNIVNIGNLFEVTSSKRVYLSDYVEQGIPFYRSKEIIQLSQGQSITDPLFISDCAFRAFSSRFGAPKENDILITSVGTIGTSYLSDGHAFYFKDGNLTWIKSNKRPDLAIYLYLWLNSDNGKKQLLTSTIGTSQSALTIEMLKKIKLIIPSQLELSQFYEYVMPIVKQNRTLRLKNQNLARQRDLLLPRLMSGKLEV